MKKGENPGRQPDCTGSCQDAYEDCVHSGVTADPCHDLYDRCAVACEEQGARPDPETKQ
jgi:hypothetical protein